VGKIAVRHLLRQFHHLLDGAGDIAGAHEAEQKRQQDPCRNPTDMDVLALAMACLASSFTDSMDPLTPVSTSLSRAMIVSPIWLASAPNWSSRA
jgi:hypothetical protein